MKSKILLFISLCLMGTIGAQTIGDYRTTVASTTIANATGWERYDGTAWVAAVNYPSGSIRQAGTAITGTNTVELNAANDLIRVGQIVTGTGIAAGTAVSAISGTTLTLSQNVTANSNAATSLVFYETLAYSATTNATTTLTLAVANTAIVPGMVVTGTGIPAGTKVVSVESATSITLSAAATNSATNNLTFYTPATTAAFTTGSSTITLNAANSLLSVGMTVYGTGLQQGTTIASISGATIGLSIPTNQTQTATGLIFGYLVIPNMYIKNNIVAGGNNRASTINNLIIESPATFSIGDGLANGNTSDFVFNTINIASGATFSNTTSANSKANSLILNGGLNGTCITNNGTLDLTPATGNLSLTRTTFLTQGNTTFAGSGVFKFNDVTLQLGSINNTLNVPVVMSMGNGNVVTLKLNSGIFKISSASTLAFPGTVTNQTIPATAGLYLNNAGANLTCGFTDGSGLKVSGLLNIADGKLKINGRFDASGLGTTIISGGTLEIPAAISYNNATISLFHVASMHNFIMTGGNINIKSYNTSGTNANPDFNIQSSYLTMSGGTVTFSDAAAIKSNCNKFYNLVVASGAGSGTTVTLQNATTTVLNQLTVNSGNTLEKGSNQTITNYSITGDVTSGSATVALQSNHNIAVGQYVSGAGINTNTTVASVSQTLVTTGNTTNGSSSVTNVPNVSNVTVGMMIYGTGIAPGTTITEISATAPYTLTLSANATVANSGIALIINPTITLSSAAIATTAATPLTFSLTAEGATSIKDLDSETAAPRITLAQSTLKISNLGLNSRVRVFDAQGRILTSKIASDNLEISLRVKGMYVVKVESATGHSTKKIIL